MLSKRILVRVPGGLGNQLFSYFAALYVSRRLGTPLEVNLASVDSKHTSGLFDLSSFRLHWDFTSRSKNIDTKIHQSKHFLQILVLKVIRKFNIWFPKYLILDSNKMSFQEIDSYLDSLEPLQQKRNIEMRGYFQESDYFEQLPEELQFLELKNPSQWYQCKQEELNKSEWIGLHIRLGDFTQISQIYGVLGPDYYLAAIRKLSAITGINKIAIFTNDVVLASNILIPSLPVEFDVKIISKGPEFNIDPAEELKLLSSCKAIIIGNSTFSIWAGIISGKNSTVAYPAPFYRNSNDLKFVFPQQWLKVDSSWWDI